MTSKHEQAGDAVGYSLRPVEGMLAAVTTLELDQIPRNNAMLNIKQAPMIVPPKLASQSSQLQVRPVRGWVSSSTTANAVPIATTQARALAGLGCQERTAAKSRAENKPYDTTCRNLSSPIPVISCGTFSLGRWVNTRIAAAKTTAAPRHNAGMNECAFKITSRLKSTTKENEGQRWEPLGRCAVERREHWSRAKAGIHQHLGHLFYNGSPFCLRRISDIFSTIMYSYIASRRQ